MASERWCPQHGLHGEWRYKDGDWDCLLDADATGAPCWQDPIAPDIVAAIKAEGAAGERERVLADDEQQMDEAERQKAEAPTLEHRYHWHRKAIFHAEQLARHRAGQHECAEARIRDDERRKIADYIAAERDRSEHNEALSEDDCRAIVIALECIEQDVRSLASTDAADGGGSDGGSMSEAPVARYVPEG